MSYLANVSKKLNNINNNSGKGLLSDKTSFANLLVVGVVVVGFGVVVVGFGVVVVGFGVVVVGFGVVVVGLDVAAVGFGVVSFGIVTERINKEWY